MRLLVFFWFFFIIACNTKHQIRISDEKKDYLSEFFLESNKEIVKFEDFMIDSLIELSGLFFLKDSSGIRILIDNKNKVQKLHKTPKDGDIVEVAYDCILFEELENLSHYSMIDTIFFQLGYSKQMRGFNHAIKLLKIGESAKIIIPSYLGFGMSGYGKEVPPYATLLLNIKLLNIKS